jgi:putative OPT family oligopeptide transporter
MGTCLLFVALGWTGDAYQAVALCVGAMVCIAASNAGNTSQDLKTGYIVGATPRFQQWGLIIGVIVSVFAVGATIMLIDNAQVNEPLVEGHAIGSSDYPAPQAVLMATIIRGLLAQDLPWGLVFAGMAIAVVIELCGIKSLSFAVGLYLPLSTTMPIAIGGFLRGLMDRKSGNKGHDESEISSGMLYATGLVAGGALTGVLIAGLQGVRTAPGRSLAQDILDKVGIHGWESHGATADIIGIVMFAGLCALLLRAAQKKLA